MLVWVFLLYSSFYLALEKEICEQSGDMEGPQTCRIELTVKILFQEIHCFVRNMACGAILMKPRVTLPSLNTELNQGVIFCASQSAVVL
jgi:hypothetical protein